jgi:hypothetical protein
MKVFTGLLCFFTLVLASVPLVAQSNNAELRIVYLTPDGPPVDAYFMSTQVPPVVTGLGFGGASAVAPVSNPSNPVPFILTRSGNSSQELINADVPVEAGKRKNIIVLNTLANISASVLDFDYNAPATDGKSYLRFLHASPDLGQVDIRLIPASGTTGLITDFDFTITTQFAEIPAGMTTIEVYQKGTQNLLLRVRGSLAGKSYYTAILSGMAAEMKVRLLNETSTLPQAPMTVMQGPPAPVSRVRIVHGLVDAPAVDFYVDGVRAAANISFRDASVLLSYPPGTHQVAMTAAGKPLNTAVFNSAQALDTNKATTVIALGRVPSPLNLVTSARDLGESVPAGKAMVRFIHGSADLANIDVTLKDAAGGASTFPNLAFSGATGYQTLPAGNLSVAVRTAGGPVVYAAKGTIAAGTVNTIIATGKIGENFLLNVLVDSDTSAQIPMAALTEEAVPQGEGTVRFVHESPDGTPSDFFLDNNPSASATLAFKDAGSVLTKVPEGIRNVKVATQGEGIGNPTLDQDVTVIPNERTTVFMVGDQVNGRQLVTGQTADSNMHPAAGNVVIRILLGSAASVPIDLDLTFSDGSTHRFAGVTYGVPTDYFEAPAGNTTLKASYLGTPLITVEGLLPANATLTGIATGLVSQGTLDIRLLLENDTNRQSPMLLFAAQSSVSRSDEAAGESISISPNPSTTGAILRYSLSRSEHARVTMYDALGRLVRIIADGQQEKGDHVVGISTENIPAGVYNIRVSHDDGSVSATSRMTVVK